jgi:Zn-dependent M28 family amino/carboxypeptidase
LRTLLIALTTLIVTPVAPHAGTGSPRDFSAERIRSHVEYLASDELGGRAPGSPGERLTLDYLIGQLTDMGCAPGNPDGTFLQEVPLLGMTVTNHPTLEVSGDGRTTNLRYGPEFVAWSLQQKPTSAVEGAELVFVGYGIVAPEYEWDDYKDVDVTDKYIGDPPHPDASLFGGKAMTYYGRWTYKYEIAAKKGAAGAIVIHTAPEAGYPWEVVSNSWSGEQFDVVRADEGRSRCRVESWITESVARDLFDRCGLSFDEARRGAARRVFRPHPLGLRASVRIETRLRPVTSYNVVGRLEGKDDKLRGEHVIYTAHWDHLGHGNAVAGDSIYNGALDNASGVAGVLEIARAFATHRDQLKRSVLFLFTTAEESGLLGATHYTQSPLYPLEDAVAMINVDGINIWGRTEDMVVVGFGQSDLDRYLEEAIASQGRHLLPDSEPEKGYYYRSDHFPFAKKGVPALYADGGINFIDRPEGWGLQMRRDYVHNRYHKPQDELDDSWDLSGALEDMEALFRVGLALATSDRYPSWSETSEFKKVGEALKGSR